jgi:AraC-like DNA-binding protein
LLREFIEKKVSQNGLVDTGIEGVQLFKITAPIDCAPVVYEPSLTAIVSGAKEAILDGDKHIFDSSKYTLCTMPIPVEAGIPEASESAPLIGVYVSLDSSIMRKLAIELESLSLDEESNLAVHSIAGMASAKWDDDFADALYRLLLLTDSEADMAVLGKSRLRELYYTLLKGEAGSTVRQSYNAGNAILRAIEFLTANAHKNITIDEIAGKVAMSRAVFHRKFKQATAMSPIQFVKSMRLNNAAKRIAQGVNVSVAAMDVGYVSSSQFSRDFKRAYGQSPKQWEKAHKSKSNLQ